MTYTGDVSVGGPADTRELPGLTITKVAVGSMNNNAYLLRCTATGELALIDAANEADTLLALVGDVPLATVITTHQHWDHWGALKEVQEATGAQTVAHPEDAEPLPVPVTHLVRHGDEIAVGNATLSVIHLRGHTPGALPCVMTMAASRTCSPGTRCSRAGRGTPRRIRPGSGR